VRVTAGDCSASIISDERSNRQVKRQLPPGGDDSGKNVRAEAVTIAGLMTITDCSSVPDRAGEETLLGVLRGAQDFVFNLCYQVLRHPQDAEDASKESCSRSWTSCPGSRTEAPEEPPRSHFVPSRLQPVGLPSRPGQAQRSKAAMTSSTAPVAPENLQAVHRAIARWTRAWEKSSSSAISKASPWTGLRGAGLLGRRRLEAAREGKEISAAHSSARGSGL